MSRQSPPAGSRLEAILVWVLLAMLLVAGLVASLPAHARLTWSVAALVAWAPGAAVLAVRGRGRRAAGALSAALGTIGGRASVALLLALVWIAALLAGTWAALLLLALLGSLVLVLAAFRPPGAIGPALVSLALVGTSLVLAALAGEGALRAVHAGERVGAPSELAAWETRYDRLWERNVLGFRSPHERVSRTAGVRRVLALGDSFTWGDKVAQSDSTWPALLEERLESAGGTGGVEVVNLGRPGYTTANEAELLRRLGWQLDPDLVIVQFFLNDALPSGENFAREGESSLSPTRRLVPASMRDAAIGRSVLLALLERQLNAVASDASDPRRYAPLYEPGMPGWEQTRRALREIGDSARAREIPVYLVIFPTFRPGRWTAESYPLADIHARIAREASDAGLRVVDLVDAFAQAGGDWRRWWATPYDGHPSPSAHLLAAETLAPAIGGDLFRDR